MKINIFYLLSVSLSLISATPSYAQWAGDYTYHTSNSVHSADLVRAGREQGKDVYICIDNVRKEPGKLVDRKCHVEWKGKEYSNNEFWTLDGTGQPNPESNSSFYWYPAPGYGGDLEYAIHSNNFDGYDYVYHCRFPAKSFFGSGQFASDAYMVGKYAPRTGRCYFTWNGKGYHTNGAKFEVLHYGPWRSGGKW